MKGDRARLTADGGGTVGVGAGDVKAHGGVEKMAGWVKEADADNVITLFAALSGEVNGRGKISIGSARAKLAGLAIPTIGEDVGENIIPRRDASYPGL